MAADPLTRWKLADPERIRWRFWDNQVVVYHADSGDTHLLNPGAGRILMSLRAGPATFDESIGRLASSTDRFQDDPESLGCIRDLLSEFEESGLVEVINR